MLILDGIDQFIDENSQKEEFPDWLPGVFPSNIKVLVTANKDSKTYKHMQSKNCPKIEIHALRPEARVEILFNHLNQIENSGNENQQSPRNKETLLTLSPEYQNVFKYIQTNQQCENPLYLITLMYAVLPTDKKINGIQCNDLIECLNYEELLKTIIDYFEDKMFKTDQLKNAFVHLCVSRRGLTQEEVMNLSHMSDQDLKNFITIFQPCLITHQEYIQINNRSIKQTLQKRYNDLLVHNKILVHSQIAQLLEKCKTTDSQLMASIQFKRLDELCYHFYESKQWFKLKDIITDIENFSILFMPDNKFDIMRYWSMLEYQGFDPVIEYNKSLETFNMYFRPANQELFVILTQLCIFFKEFADMESSYTPQYRHPYLKSNELKDINILEEINSKNMEGMYSNTNRSAILPEEDFNVENAVARQQIRDSIIESSKSQKQNQGDNTQQKLNYYYYKR